MDNSFATNNQPQSGQSASYPANSQPSPQTNMTFGPDGRPVTGVRLETPVLTPTQTRENLNNYRQPVGQPVRPGAARSSNTGMTMLCAVLGMLAVVGIILGLFGMVDSTSANERVTELQADLANKNAIIGAISEQTNTKIESVKDVPTYVATTGYIYLDEWGIKIETPSELHHISYILNMRLYHPTICFNAVETSITNPLPAFTDVAQNPGGMGCLVRISAEEGDRGTDGLNFGEKVFSDNGYNYFYTSPAKVYSTENSDIQLEKHAVALIKTMLSTDNISAYQ